MSGIFISYRRSDSAGHTGRLADDLGKQLDGQALFRDIEAIEAGVDFVHALEKAVEACTVMLVVIGPTWASATTSDGQRRLHQPGDFVRMEIEAALARDIRVIPVLVGDAQMPGPADLPESMAGLLRRNAYSISDRRWQYDVSQLLEILIKIPGVAALKSAAAAAPAARVPGAPPPPPAPLSTPAPASPPAKGGMPGWVKGALATVGMVALVGFALDKWASDDPVKTPIVQEPAAEPAQTSAAADPVATPPNLADAQKKDFLGKWVDSDGMEYLVDESDSGIYVASGSNLVAGTGFAEDSPAPDQAGQELFGDATIRGRRLKVTLSDGFNDDKTTLDLELTGNGEELVGTVQKGSGEPEAFALARLADQ
jgi:hypothetical protein